MNLLNDKNITPLGNRNNYIFKIDSKPKFHSDKSSENIC